MAEISLSYIIPCYNMERYLSVCLDSVLAQGHDQEVYEVIIVNDESTDSTLQIAKEYAEKHQNIHIIDKKNAGVGAARNSGLLRAQGEYVYFMDPDDYLATGCMGIALNKAREGEFDILSFTSIEVRQDEYSPESLSDLDSLKDTPLNSTDGIEYIANFRFRPEMWRNLIRRGFIEAHGFRFIEGRWMEDAILIAQMLCVAKRVAHLDMDIHRYRILPTSAMHRKDPEHYRKMIYDIGFVSHCYADLITKLPPEHPYYDACKKRLVARKQSFVFFMLIRLMKSDIDVGKIPEMLQEYEKIEAYPLDRFIGEDYHGFAYSFLVFIFNRKSIIAPFTRLFRLSYRLVG